MADFSKLPNEMISEIWGHVLEPRDVESFAWVSKCIYTIGRPFVQEHNKLKRKYAQVEFNYHDSVSAPAVLLRKVLLRPRIALYVTHLFIDSYRGVWQDPQEDEEHDDDDDDDDYYDSDEDADSDEDSNCEWPSTSHVPYPDAVMALFTGAIRNSSLVRPNEVWWWIEALKEGDEDPILAFLSFLLPNLVRVSFTDSAFDKRDISLGTTFYHRDMFLGTIRRIAEAGDTIFLTRLTTIAIVFQIDEARMYLNWLKPFAALPSVQSIHVSYSGGTLESIYPGDYPETYYFFPGSYNISEITFENSGLQPKLLSELLDNITGLKKFTYMERDKMFCRFEPFWVRAALLATAKHSIECLKILSPRTQEKRRLGTLRGFTALKELETDLSLLMHHNSYFDLAKLLPASIEKLYLHARDIKPDSNISIIVQEIMEAKSQLVPNLKVLKIRTKIRTKHEMAFLQEGKTLTKTLEETCRDGGVELLFTI